jgi:hypothetical protein
MSAIELRQTRIKETVVAVSQNYTRIVSFPILEQNNLGWGKNGVGDRWAGKLFNYTVVYANGKTRRYSQTDTDVISMEIITEFITTTPKQTGIIGIFVHSIRSDCTNRPIRKDIRDSFKNCGCVVCGNKSNTICDHKNDLYNDPRVLNTTTQTADDFQCLCNSCNLQKRSIAIKETADEKIYSAANIPMFANISIFPWEKRAYDKTDPTCKIGSYWYDPVAFMRNYTLYTRYVMPVVIELRRRRIPIE